MTELTQVTQSGIVTFRIPEGWSVEFGDEGGGCFWDSTAQFGTLRLDILTFEKDGELTPDSLLGIFQSTLEKHPTAEVDSIDSMNAVLEYEIYSEEDGEPLRIVFWERVRGVPPNRFCLAIFSYTDSRENFGSAETRSLIEVMRREVRACEFAE